MAVIRGVGVCVTVHMCTWRGVKGGGVIKSANCLIRCGGHTVYVKVVSADAAE